MTQVPTYLGGEKQCTFTVLVSYTVPVVRAARSASRSADDPARGRQIADEVDISGPLGSWSRFNGEMHEDRIEAVRQQIAAGTYETGDKINVAVERLLDESVILFITGRGVPRGVAMWRAGTAHTDVGSQALWFTPSLRAETRFCRISPGSATTSARNSSTCCGADRQAATAPSLPSRPWRRPGRRPAAQEIVRPALLLDHCGCRLRVGESLVQVLPVAAGRHAAIKMFSWP